MNGKVRPGDTTGLMAAAGRGHLRIVEVTNHLRKVIIWSPMSGNSHH